MAYKKKKKGWKGLEAVIAHVKSTFNNTIVSVTTPSGDVVVRGSSGMLGFSGSRKGTPFAATQVGSRVAKELAAMGVKLVEMNLQGPGSGKESVVRAFQAAGLTITKLRDVTPLPHNGCRPPKRRRV